MLLCTDSHAPLTGSSAASAAFGDVTATNICHAVCFHIPLLPCPSFTETPTRAYTLLDTRSALPGALMLNDPKILGAA